MTRQDSMLLPCDVTRFYMGSRTKTTFRETWKHGKTVSVRVPEKLKTQVLKLARQLDNSKKLTFDSEINKRQLLNILEDFIELKRSQYGENGTQVKKKFSRNTRGWDVFNQLYDSLKE